jgi:uncharacterized membrane protein
VDLDAAALNQRNLIREEKGGSMMSVRELINLAGLMLDLAGVAAIIFGVIWASASYIWQPKDTANSYRSFRKSVGRSILLGLEFLVGGDIIRTVSVERPALESVVALGVIVMIRITLSWAMEIELEGCWPWQGRKLGDESSQNVKDGV